MRHQAVRSAFTSSLLVMKRANFLFPALSFRQIDAEGRLQKLTDTGFRNDSSC